jgi:hypothetical protein
MAVGAPFALGQGAVLTYATSDGGITWVASEEVYSPQNETDLVLATSWT